MTNFVSLEKQTLSAQQQLLMNSLDQFYAKTKINSFLFCKVPPNYLLELLTGL